MSCRNTAYPGARDLTANDRREARASIVGAMRIALIQQQASPDKGRNLARGLEALGRAADDGAELVAFAELAFEPFWPQRPAEGDVRRLAEPVPGPITEAFQARAAELGVVMVLNLFERDGDCCYDCSPVIDADGTLLGRTRMVHITDYPCFHEQGYYTPGDTGAPVYQTRAGRIGVAICYDRHYPEYLRALALGGAELVVVPQAGAVDEWPEGLYEAEMRVAAFQNGYFVALCNRVGEEDAAELRRRELCLRSRRPRDGTGGLARRGDPGRRPGPGPGGDVPRQTPVSARPSAGAVRRLAEGRLA